jgi:hypothetical protein
MPFIMGNAFFSGMLSATASLGLILLWDVDGGLTQIDKYLYSSEDFIKVCFISKVFMVKVIVLKENISFN